MTVTPWMRIILLTLILEETIPVVLSKAYCPDCVREGCCDRLNDITVKELEVGQNLSLKAWGSTAMGGCQWWKLAEDGSKHCCFSDPYNYKRVCGEDHTNPEGCRPMEEVKIDVRAMEDMCILNIEYVTNMDNGTYQCSIAYDRESDGEIRAKFPVIVKNSSSCVNNLTNGLVVTIVILVILLITMALLYKREKDQREWVRPKRL